MDTPNFTIVGAPNSCAWCSIPIPDHIEVFGLSAKSRPNVDLTRYRGEAIELKLSLDAQQKTIPVIVTGLDSPAAKEGSDFIFGTCIRACAKQLKVALEQEVELANKLLWGPRLIG